MPPSLSELYSQLTVDLKRADEIGFSDDITEANVVLLDRFARDPERKTELENWLQGEKNQPCLFGRIAAKYGGMHFCFLTVEDLVQSDDHIRTKIARSRNLWKQRAYRGEPRHGFMLSICDFKVAWARPDRVLYEFALRLQVLAGWIGRKDIRDNSIFDEWLYLRNPNNGEAVKFTFSVDFFAAAGDKRWWHDHRVPGGMAFTANSLGHMVRHREWYEEKTGQIEWATRTAMLTIDSAKKDVPYGPATYLLDESHGRPLRPYTWTDATKPSDRAKLEGKDCGSYAGYLHTDHSVRAEFFQPQDVPLYRDEPYGMEFDYIFDRASKDHLPFMLGEVVNESDVYDEIGMPADLRIVAPGAASASAEDEPATSLSRSVQDALEKSRRWMLTDEELARLS